MKKTDSESLDDYLLRLGNNKEMYALNWVQIAEKMNEASNEDFGESKWRKDYSLIKKGFDLANKRNIQNDEILNEYEMKKIEAETAVKKVQSVKIEYNKLLRENARFDLKWDMVKDSIEKLPAPDFQLDNFYSKDNDRVGVMSFADIHFGKYFKSINNEYSEEIATNRMQQLLYETLEIVNQQGFEHIHIINGADSIEGMSLRVSQLQSISMGFIDQTIKFSKFIASWLNELSKHVRITYHHVPASNHSQIRPFNSSRSEFVSEDLEKIIMNYVHDVLEYNPNVDVPLYEGDIIKLDILGYKVWALHGHQLKGKKNAIRDLSVLHREFIDYLYIAHFHHAGSLTVGIGANNDIEVIQIPSVMGSDEYSDSLMTGAKAGALFSVFERGKGRAIEYKIKLN
ncbi:hypothetical protein NV379_02575 [Paenibacillus sp. N1-5-1-14]|uniref:hypothetical protein n=1 Tax=Paenibacillus radicibacter TaxID=2972488 RepID=UPI002159A5E7|nr:hypothetical protein [Paenibacillus radicibacter]MCR8641532.1 hypothetical protein [Paenibacillus radicibacter]